MVPLAQLLQNQSLFGQVLFTLDLNLHSLRDVRFHPCNHTSNSETQILGEDGRCGESLPLPQQHSLGPPAGLSSWYLKDHHET